MSLVIHGILKVLLRDVKSIPPPYLRTAMIQISSNQSSEAKAIQLHGQN